jgi:cytochrome d ubiquinol oxidase subunit II
LPMAFQFGLNWAPFSEQARSQLFTAPLLYIFGAIPILGLVLIGLLLGSLKRREENAPLIWTFLIFALSFIFN